MTLYKLSERFNIVDSHVVFSDDNGKKTVVPKETFLNRATADEKLMFKTYCEKNTIADLLKIRQDNDCDLLAYCSDSLFNFATKEIKKFIKKNGIYVPIADRAIGKKMAEKVESFEVLRINFHGEKILYLYQNISPVAMAFDLTKTVENDIHHSKDNSAFEKILNLSNFTLSDQDLGILKGYTSIAGIDRLKYITDLVVAYRHVCRDFHNSFMLQSWRDPTAGDLFPRVMAPITVEEYSSNTVTFCFIVDVFKNLSFAPRAAGLFDDATVDMPSVCFKLLSDHRYSEAGKIILKLMAFDWTKYTANQPQLLTAFSYRKLLDSMKFTLSHYAVCYIVDHSWQGRPKSLFEGDYYSFITSLYHFIAHDCLKMESVKEAVQTGPDFIYIDGLKASKSYLHDFYFQVLDEYDALLKNINETIVPLKSIEFVAVNALNASGPHINMFEDRRAPNRSVWTMFKRPLVESLLPNAEQLTNFNSVGFLAESNKLTLRLMWMIYFAGGGPFRVPELMTLKFGGNAKNIFIDGFKRRLEILSNYGKNGSGDIKVKVLDKRTSDYLFHYLFIIRPLQVYCMNNDYSRFKRNLFNESHISDELEEMEEAKIRGPSNDLHSLGEIVLKSFIFVDVVKGRLIDARTFRTSSRNYPATTTPNNRLGINTLRHSFIGLFRNSGYEKDEAKAEEDAKAKEVSSGHSHTTGFQKYSFNPYTTGGSSISTFVKYNTALDWLKWFGLEKGYVKEDVKKITLDSSYVNKYWVIPKSITGLYIAGSRLYGPNFQFRPGQFELVTEILFSCERVVPIMALPAFGKTMLVQLPMTVLQSHASIKSVSFYFVPYSVLMSSIHLQLSKSLRVDYVKSLFDPTGKFLKKGIYNEDLPSVLIGNFNDLANPAYQDLIQHFHLYFPDVVLSYLVIDEVHNIVTEEYRKNVIDRAVAYDTSLFTKIILLSGTIYKARFQQVCDKMEFKKQLCERLDEVTDKRIKLWNHINDIPLQNVLKKFKAYDNQESIFKDVPRIVETFLKERPGESMLIVCGDKGHVRDLHLRLEDVSLMITGDNTSPEKLDVLEGFINNEEGKRVLIGTKMISEGCDISSVKCVLIVHHFPPIDVYIQTVGRLRSGGVAITMHCKSTKGNHDLKRVCISKLIAQFYKLRYKGCCGCCSHDSKVSNLISQDSADLLASIFI
ncbi:hypothetical protein MOUN0_F00166 [Monosporozyma unispora]